MRFLFKTDYNQDIRLAKHGGQTFWYSLLGLFLVTAPWVIQEYWLAQLTFVLIYSIVGLGLMLLAGFTGLFSLGHAAFLGVGAYTQAIMVNAGIPFPLALACAGLLSAAVGMVVGLPALRVKGIYLGMATLAFGFIVEEIMARWEHVTGGNSGLVVNAPASSAGSWSPPTSSTSCAWWSRCWPRWPLPTSCAHPPGARLSPSAIRRFRRRAWAFNWRATRP